MKIIFLDIDGVLNNADESDHHIHKSGCYFYSPLCVERLNTVINSTEAKIVVSSTWRLGRTVEELQVLLSDMGVVGEVIDKTCRLDHVGGFRGNEIYKWIKDNQHIIGCDYWKFKQYIILDDDSDMLLWQKDNFVQTDGYKGLTDREMYDAIWMLQIAENLD